MTQRIGIDVGGTNTDAVLIAGNDIVARIKTPTTRDITSGVLAAMNALVQNRTTAQNISAVMIGTTHFVNAVVQRDGLSPVAAMRIALPAAAQVRPFADWPEDLRRHVEGPVFQIRGGHEVDGSPIVPLDHEAIAQAARAIRASGISAVGVTAAFSPLTAAAEIEAERIIRDIAPEVLVTCSHRLGRIGLLARENVTLLNASLQDLARRTIEGFQQARLASGIAAPLFITQNDGTMVRAEHATAYPVLCFGSGPTNSLRGAAFLSGLKDAMVNDVGGTTSDIGTLASGFPREANNVVYVGGVRTLFRMPDTFSVGLGGGTIVDQANPRNIGPKSVGFRLASEALVFGGNTLTCSDIAVAAGLTDMGDPSRVSHLSAQFVKDALHRIHEIGIDAVNHMKTSFEDVPLIAVGGAAFLVPDEIPGISNVVRVAEPGVANAVGAAMAQVSGEIDHIFQDVSRDDALATARSLADAKAREAGAEPDSIEMIELEDLPIAYMRGNALRVRIRVAGRMAQENLMQGAIE